VPLKTSRRLTSAGLSLCRWACLSTWSGSVLSVGISIRELPWNSIVVYGPGSLLRPPCKYTQQLGSPPRLVVGDVLCRLCRLRDIIFVRYTPAAVRSARLRHKMDKIQRSRSVDAYWQFTPTVRSLSIRRDRGHSAVWGKGTEHMRPRERITFKLCLRVYKAMNGLAPFLAVRRYA